MTVLHRRSDEDVWTREGELISAFYGKARVSCQLISSLPDWVTLGQCSSDWSLQASSSTLPLSAYQLLLLNWFLCYCVLQCRLVQWPLRSRLIYPALSNGLHSFFMLGCAVATLRIFLTLSPSHPRTMISFLLGQCPSPVTKFHPFIATIDVPKGWRFPSK